VVLWTGTGTPAVLLVMVHAALWPVYLNLQSGLDEIPQRYRDMSRNWQLRGVGVFIHIIVPAVFQPCCRDSAPRGPDPGAPS